MAKVNFTAKRVQEFVCPAGKVQDFLWDATPGFGLRATVGGAKSYVFQGKLHGRSLRLTIGDPRSWTIDKAREEARRLQTLVDAGKDPREEKREAEAAHAARQAAALRKDVTVTEAWKVYLAARKSKWSARHYLDHERLAQTGGREVKRGQGRLVAGPLASLMKLRLSELTRPAVETWLETEAAKRPARVRLAFALLRAFVTWCASRAEFAGLASPDICTSRTLREHLPAPATRDDCLQCEQLAGWFAAVRRLGNPVIAAYLQGLLLTGARREELLGLRWGDVDFQWGSLTIRDKVEGERTIPLTPYLASLLAALPRRNAWVFSSPAAADGRLVEPRAAHNQALAVAGLPHVTLHGLRRSFGTLSEWCEVPVGVVAQIMGHKPSAIAEKHYRRRPLDLLRKWHGQIEAWVLEQAGVEFTAATDGQTLRVVV